MRIAYLLTILTMLIGGATLRATLPTAPFRQEHVEVKEHLAHIDAMVGQLGATKADQQRSTMTAVAKFLADHILTHAEWEEKYLYPAVDKRTTAGEHPFTESMRYEHRIVGRSIDELKRMAAADKLEPTVFARRADRLLGLILAHFEEEEQVLLPILDRTMSAEDFEKEMGRPH